MSQLKKCFCGEKDVEGCAYSCNLNEVNTYVEEKPKVKSNIIDMGNMSLIQFGTGYFAEPKNLFSLNQNESYEGVKAFHKAFNHPAPEKPVAIPVDVAIKRASWTMEELVEFLHASVGGNPEEFSKALTEFGNAFNAAVEKQLKEGEYEDKSDAEILVRQVDALTDISYFNYGSFVVAGVNPQPFFNIVQAANMGKLDRETGKPIIRESDGKIMKPSYWEAEFAPEPKLRAELAKQMG